MVRTSEGITKETNLKSLKLATVPASLADPGSLTTSFCSFSAWSTWSDIVTWKKKKWDKLFLSQRGKQKTQRCTVNTTILFFFLNMKLEKKEFCECCIYIIYWKPSLNILMPYPSPSHVGCEELEIPHLIPTALFEL